MHIKKLKYLCRRGTKELDLLTTSYLELYYGNASKAAQQLFHKLLLMEDTDLYDWIHRADVPPTCSSDQLHHAIKQHFQQSNG